MRQRKVKIVATLGPASNTYDVIRNLKKEGADVFRLNMSHGQHADIAKLHGAIREVEKDLGEPICILADLQGPKLRCGEFDGGEAHLQAGGEFRFDLDTRVGDDTRVCLPHPEIFRALHPGVSILVNDGLLRLTVLDCAADFARCRVDVGGRISNRKGVNVPDVVLPLAALSEKDRKDLEFVCELGVDWIALSFVQRPEDVIEAQDLVQGRARVLSKIEKPAAVAAFQDILTQSEGIMVARGDLGVELPVQQVPSIQKRLVRECRKVGKPVIVATQMLESMTSAPVPTRAEVSDVAAAIYEGADAVMLSAESAAGDFPIEAVRTMNDVALETERDAGYRQTIEASRVPCRDTIAGATTAAAREIAETTELKAICCYTQSGYTAQLASREKPRVPIIALTPNVETARHLGLVWGLTCVPVAQGSRFRDAVVSAVSTARRIGVAQGDEKIVITAGVPLNVKGGTNILRIAPVNETLEASEDQ
ncbi:pyruvate kinase [Shimia thalassica]|uniref:pyruvate kinase n=1 Tax=Shimia thalassica TaxID=1715693 RepID=UPI001C09FB67|nr:pyruvate kinase [Shimia thalassica]MBU2943876.1 pyruvate kinase [Shimia thalassica]MDO6505057.1 pyruvate kinase [Shimia thalassica]